MNNVITQTSQQVDAPAIDARAEAVCGLARDRTILVREWRETSRSWRGYDAFAIECHVAREMRLYRNEAWKNARAIGWSLMGIGLLMLARGMMK
jgi:hypothetical protein